MFASNRFNRISIALPVEGNSGMDWVTWAIWARPSLMPISFRAAASRFGVTLSALSHSMRLLEGRVGVQSLTSGQVVVDNLAEA
jgi:hypothetical protein